MVIIPLVHQERNHTIAWQLIGCGFGRSTPPVKWRNSHLKFQRIGGLFCFNLHQRIKMVLALYLSHVPGRLRIAENDVIIWYICYPKIQLFIFGTNMVFLVLRWREQLAGGGHVLPDRNRYCSRLFVECRMRCVVQCMLWIGLECCFDRRH